MWNSLNFRSESSDHSSVVSSEISSSPDDRLTPEKRLLLAVLEQAIRDVLDHDKPHGKQAERWFFEDWNTEHSLPFSLSWICRHLDIDMTQTQKKVREFIEHGIPAGMAWAFRRQ